MNKHCFSKHYFLKTNARICYTPLTSLRSLKIFKNKELVNKNFPTLPEEPIEFVNLDLGYLQFNFPHGITTGAAVQLRAEDLGSTVGVLPKPSSAGLVSLSCFMLGEAMYGWNRFSWVRLGWVGLGEVRL